ncbi:MAG TPA: hypothetical protein DD719_05235, partial [Desulfotomaculum sp.]|nr:hypothetical protein [Desulfotomaculum sp.]
LRECLDKPSPDRASFEKLLEAADLSASNSTRKDLYEYLEKTLGITRDVLYQRMKKIRDLLKKFFREENIF